MYKYNIFFIYSFVAVKEILYLRVDYMFLWFRPKYIPFYTVRKTSVRYTCAVEQLPVYVPAHLKICCLPPCKCKGA